jgi:predicted dehydrogenase
MTGRGSFAMVNSEEGSAWPGAEGGRLSATHFTRLRSEGGPAHTRCIAEWLKMLRGEPAEVVTPGSDSRSTVEVAEAAYRSEETGREIQLPIEPRPWNPAKRG